MSARLVVLERAEWSSAGASADASNVEVVGAPGGDVFEAGRADAGDEVIGKADAGRAVGVDRVLQVEGGPQDAGVGQQGVAVRLHGLVVVVTVVDVATLGDPQVAA